MWKVEAIFHSITSPNCAIENSMSFGKDEVSGCSTRWEAQRIRENGRSERTTDRASEVAKERGGVLATYPHERTIALVNWKFTYDCSPMNKIHANKTITRIKRKENIICEHPHTRSHTKDIHNVLVIQMLFETTFRSLSLFFKHRLFLFLFPLLQRLSTCATVRWYKIAVWIENFSSSTMKCSFWQTIVECYQIEYVDETARKLCLYDFFLFSTLFSKSFEEKRHRKTVDRFIQVDLRAICNWVHFDYRRKLQQISF